MSLLLLLRNSARSPTTGTAPAAVSLSGTAATTGTAPASVSLAGVAVSRTTGSQPAQIALTAVAVSPGGPARIGFAYQPVGETATSCTVTPDGTIALGHWMLLVLTTNSTVTVTDPVGWTVLQAATSAGTLKTGIYAKFREVGDTGYTVGVSAFGTATSAALMWGYGADAISTWQVGAAGTRSVDRTNTAPSVTTVANNSLALIVSTERTTATETAITSITGATEWFFGAQSGSMIQTTEIGYIANITPAGVTGDVTIVYPNTQLVNGMARQIILPPGPVTTGALAGLVSLTAGASSTTVAATTGTAPANVALTGVAVGQTTGSQPVQITLSGAALQRATTTGAISMAVVLTGATSIILSATGAAGAVLSLTGRGLMGTFWDGTTLRTGEIYYWSGTARSELKVTDLQVMT